MNVHLRPMNALLLYEGNYICARVEVIIRQIVERGWDWDVPLLVWYSSRGGSQSKKSNRTPGGDREHTACCLRELIGGDRPHGLYCPLFNWA